MKKRIEEEIRKRMEDDSTYQTGWAGAAVNNMLYLIDEGKISDEDASRFWTMHEVLVSDNLTKDQNRFDYTFKAFGTFCEQIVVDEVHRTRSKYKVPEQIRYLLEEPSELYKTIKFDESERIKRIIADVYKDNSKLIALGSREFEEMVAELLAKQGFKVELTKRTKDGGYDIIALLNYNHHNPMKFLVECKRRAKNKVGVEVIRSFKNVVDSTNVNRGIFVTTSYFTKGSWDEQKKYPYLLDYRDKDKVIEWVNGYCNDIS